MSFAISSEKNSTIYQNPDPQDLIDFSFLGVMEKIDNSKVVIISPETQIDNKQMLNFSKEICSKLYEEGYKIGQNFNLSLLEK